MYFLFHTENKMINSTKTHKKITFANTQKQL